MEHTSSIVNLFYPDIAQTDARLNIEYLLCFGSRGQKQKVPIQETDQILAIDAFSCLPTNMENTTEMNMPKSSHYALRSCIRLRKLAKARHSVEQYVPSRKTSDDPATAMSFRV